MAAYFFDTSARVKYYHTELGSDRVNALIQTEVGARTGFSVGPDVAAYAGRVPLLGPLPVTEQLAPRILSLPIFPELSDAQVDRVAELIRSVRDS